MESKRDTQKGGDQKLKEIKECLESDVFKREQATHECLTWAFKAGLLLLAIFSLFLIF